MEWIVARALRHRHGTAAAVLLRVAVLEALEAAIARQYRFPVPASEAGLRPTLVVRGPAAVPDHAVDRRRPADDATRAARRCGARRVRPPARFRTASWRRADGTARRSSAARERSGSSRCRPPRPVRRDRTDPRTAARRDRHPAVPAPTIMISAILSIVASERDACGIARRAVRALAAPAPWPLLRVGELLLGFFQRRHRVDLVDARRAPSPRSGRPAGCACCTGGSI